MDRLSFGIVCAAAAASLASCAPTQRAARLVIDHHIGMAQGAMDIVSGKAEEREQRVAQLQSDLEKNRVALSAEQDQTRLIDLLKEHVALQDALIGELMQGHGQHGAHQQAKADGSAGELPSGHQH